jgi:hypothetical protein
MKTRTIWTNAASIGEEITRQLAEEFAHSKPRPRNRAMGFSGTDKKPRREFDPFKRPPSPPSQRRP